MGEEISRNPMKQFYIVLIGFLILLPFNVANSASAPCGDRDAIIHKLDNAYSEEPVSIGIVENGSLIEIFVSENGTFTVLITYPKGLTCLVATGNSWESAFPILEGKKI